MVSDLCLVPALGLFRHRHIVEHVRTLQGSVFMLWLRANFVFLFLFGGGCEGCGWEGTNGWWAALRGKVIVLTLYLYHWIDALSKVIFWTLPYVAVGVYKRTSRPKSTGSAIGAYTVGVQIDPCWASVKGLDLIVKNPLHARSGLVASKENCRAAGA